MQLSIEPATLINIGTLILLILNRIDSMQGRSKLATKIDYNTSVTEAVGTKVGAEPVEQKKPELEKTNG